MRPRTCASFLVILGAVEGGPQSRELSEGRSLPGLVSDYNVGMGHHDSDLVGRVQTNPARATATGHLRTRSA